MPKAPQANTASCSQDRIQSHPYSLNQFCCANPTVHAHPQPKECKKRKSNEMATNLRAQEWISGNKHQSQTKKAKQANADNQSRCRVACSRSLFYTAVLVFGCSIRSSRGSIGALGSRAIWFIRNVFSSANWSSSLRSARKLGRKRRSRSLLLMRMRCTGTVLVGFATKIYHSEWHANLRAWLVSYLEDVERLVLHHATIVF